MHELATIGCGLKYCVETTKGTRPTSGYTTLVGVKSVPSTGDAPNTLQVTDLADKRHRYIFGVQDSGGAKAYTFNDDADTREAWNTMLEAYETASASGKAMWFEETFPGGLDSFYYEGIPAEWVSNERGVDAVLEGTGYIAPNDIIGFATPSTSA